MLTWLRKNCKIDWTQSPKAKESPAQKIKRLELALKDEHLRNLLLNEVVNILDAEHETSWTSKPSEKVYCQVARSLQKQKIVSLESACKLLGITRQAIYQRESRAKLRATR